MIVKWHSEEHKVDFQTDGTDLKPGIFLEASSLCLIHNHRYFITLGNHCCKAPSCHLCKLLNISSGVHTLLIHTRRELLRSPK